MENKNTNQGKQDKQDQEIKPENHKTAAQDQIVAAAHEQAQEDIDKDPEFSATSPNDDLDESESVRRNDDNTDLV